MDRPPCPDRCLHVLVAANDVAEVRAACRTDASQVHHTSAELETPLHVAAVEGSFECADVLLSNGADPFARDVDDFTPLMLAVMFGNVDVARLLVRFGGIDLVDRTGRTALHISAEEAEIECVRLLLANGANPNALDILGRLPIQLCVLQQSAEVAWAIYQEMEVQRNLPK